MIREAEEQYNQACENNAPLSEIDKLEKHSNDSLRLLSIYKLDEEKKKK